MTLEQRARLIADKCIPMLSTEHHGQIEQFALKMIREAVDEALTRAGVEAPSHREWTGAK